MVPPLASSAQGVVHGGEGRERGAAGPTGVKRSRFRGRATSNRRLLSRNARAWANTGPQTTEYLPIDTLPSVWQR